MRTHHLKTWPEPFEAVIDGRKRFEFRWDDRGFAVGDILLLKKWDPTPSTYGIDGQVGQLKDAGGMPIDTEVRVTYILKSMGVLGGYCVMGIEPVGDEQ